jgi:phage gp36-like protein
MTYATLDDIELRIGQARLIHLTDDACSGQVNVDVVNEARDGAVGEVHSYLAHRYAVPIDPIARPHAAAWLRTLVLDLVEYRLHGRRPPVPDDLIRRRAAVVQWLERLADGTVDLPSKEPVPVAPGKGRRAATAGDLRTLNRRTLDDY